MNTPLQDILNKARETLYALAGQHIDVVTLAKPPNVQYAAYLTKIISKLSPLVGNLLEFSVVESLNQAMATQQKGYWIRQDPGFPDTVFEGTIQPKPGIEIKTWFPLATEITARFKDSQRYFMDDQTLVAVIAWLPEFIIYGRPQIIDVWVGSGQSLAQARDQHYHQPPTYLVLEPEDTSARTSNLQQSNTNGYRFQESAERLAEALADIQAWGIDGKLYRVDAAYQQQLRTLLARYNYRLDTNFAKIDRIQHPDLEAFKTKILNTSIRGHTILQWAKSDLLTNEEQLAKLLR